MREIERVRQFGFTASEYARAKADYLRSLEVAIMNETNSVQTATSKSTYVTSSTTNRFRVSKTNIRS